MARVFSSLCAAYMYVIAVMPRHCVSSPNQLGYVKSLYPPPVYEDRDNITLANIDAASPMICALKCLQTEGCRSFLYKGTDVPQHNCFSEKTPQQFSGLSNVAYSGSMCRHWDSNHYWRNHISDASFPDGSVSEARNYCRDPTRQGFLWCPLETRIDSWQSCNIPRCMQTNCRLYEYRFPDVYGPRVQLAENIVFYD